MRRTERSELTNSCPKDTYKFKLRITNNTNLNITEWLEIHENQFYTVTIESGLEN